MIDLEKYEEALGRYKKLIVTNKNSVPRDVAWKRTTSRGRIGDTGEPSRKHERRSKVLGDIGRAFFAVRGFRDGSYE